MKYTELADYPYLWVFKRPDLNICTEDLNQIKPLTSEHAEQIWRNNISPSAKELNRLNSGDWPRNNDNWIEEYRWSDDFNSDEALLPQTLKQHLNNWSNDTLVYVCYEPNHVLETRFNVFQRCWKGFLFCSDSVLIIGRKQANALWFHDENGVKLGQK